MLQDNIRQLAARMERTTHPCDRGELLHIMQQKQDELTKLIENIL